MRKSKNNQKSFEQEMLASLKEANQFHDGKISLRQSNLELPDMPKPLKEKEIKDIRESLRLSQPVMARYLGVSDDAVKSWERGGSRPNGAALRLLRIAKEHPEEFFALIG